MPRVNLKIPMMNVKISARNSSRGRASKTFIYFIFVIAYLFFESSLRSYFGRGLTVAFAVVVFLVGRIVADKFGKP